MGLYQTREKFSVRPAPDHLERLVQEGYLSIAGEDQWTSLDAFYAILLEFNDQKLLTVTVFRYYSVVVIAHWLFLPSMYFGIASFYVLNGSAFSRWDFLLFSFAVLASVLSVLQNAWYRRREKIRYERLMKILNKA